MVTIIVIGLSAPMFSWPFSCTNVFMAYLLNHSFDHGLSNAPKMFMAYQFAPMFSWPFCLPQCFHGLPVAPMFPWLISCTKVFMACPMLQNVNDLSNAHKKFMACQKIHQKVHQSFHGLSVGTNVFMVFQFAPKFSWPVQCTKIFMACLMHQKIHVLSSAPKYS